MVDRVETDVSPFKPGGRFVEEDGTLTGDGYRFLDQIWKRTGGFTDGAWDSSAIAESLQTQISELNTTVEGLLANRGFEDDSRAIDLLQRIEALEAGLVDTSDQAEAALRQALNIDDPNIVNDGVRNRSLARRAATSTAFASASFGPFNPAEYITTKIGGSTADDPGRELLTVEASISDANPGDPLLIIFDYNLRFDGALAQHLCFHSKVWIMNDSSSINNDFFGDGSDDYSVTSDGTRGMTRIFNRVREVQTDIRSGANISLEANNSAASLSYPETGMTIISAPSDINTTPKKVVAAFVFDRDQIAYSSGNEYGQKSEDATKTYDIEDFDLVVINLKEKQ